MTSPNRIDRQHAIRLSGPIDVVFPLFTPRGEKLWVKKWDPEFVHPTSGDAAPEMVFRTGQGEEQTLWACVDWEPTNHRVRYVRVTPPSRFDFVEVACRAKTNDHTDATVRYSYTALSPQGQEYLDRMSEAAFARMIGEWETLINEWLAARRP